MTSSLLIPAFAGFSTAAVGANRLFDTRINLEGQEWRSNNGATQVIRARLRGVGLIDRLYIGGLGSDLSSDGVLIEVYFLNAQGTRYRQPVLRVENENIVRGRAGAYGFSSDFAKDHPNYRELPPDWTYARNYRDEVDLVLSSPVEALGIEILLQGVGWFWGRSVHMYGEMLELTPRTHLVRAKQLNRHNSRAYWEVPVTELV